MDAGQSDTILRAELRWRRTVLAVCALIRNRRTASKPRGLSGCGACLTSIPRRASNTVRRVLGRCRQELLSLHAATVPAKPNRWPLEPSMAAESSTVGISPATLRSRQQGPASAASLANRLLNLGIEQSSDVHRGEAELQHDQRRCTVMPSSRDPRQNAALMRRRRSSPAIGLHRKGQTRAPSIWWKGTSQQQAGIAERVFGRAPCCIRTARKTASEFANPLQRRVQHHGFIERHSRHSRDHSACHAVSVQQ